MFDVWTERINEKVTLFMYSKFSVASNSTALQNFRVNKKTVNLYGSSRCVTVYTRWFKYDRD